MDNNYDKEIGLRELVLQELSDIVDDLVILHEQDPKCVFSEESKYCILLTICLERCITFGMRDSGFFNKRDLFEFLAKCSTVNSKDEYLQQDFNSVQILLLNKSGKARAWIRKTINEGHLATSLYSLASDREFIKSWFEPYAIMSTNAINDLYREIEKLEQFHFQFSLKDRLLDQDDLFALLSISIAHLLWFVHVLSQIRTVYICTYFVHRPPSQYRGQNKLVRLRDDDDDEEDANDNNSNDKKKDKKSKKKKDKKDKLKRAKSKRKAGLNEVNESLTADANLTVDVDVNKSMSPHSDADSSSKKDKNKRKKKERKKKKKNKEKQTENDDEELDDNEENEDIDEQKDEEEMPSDRKPSLKDWQEQHASNMSIAKTENHTVIMQVNVNQNAVHRTLTAQKKGSISERMQSKLSAIKINMDGNYDESELEDKPFRISSPSDYHTSFKWNDAAKDDSSEIIKKLYDDEHNKNKKNFPAPGDYEQKEQQFFEQIDAEDDNEMDDKQLEQEITSLIQNAPNDGNEELEEEDDDDISLSSEQDEIDDLNLSRSASPNHNNHNNNNINTIPEHVEQDNTMNTSMPSNNNKSIFYSPKEDKSSTATSATSESSSTAYQSTLTESKREEILSTNDEYHRRKQQQTNNNNNMNATEEAEKYAPECQTFIHFTHSTQSALSSDPTKNSLNIYLQSDNYFDDNNKQRDRRKMQQDKESRKRMQREQDVMRGNDSVSIQKSLNSSGMSGSGGIDNKPLDPAGNKIVLPSTGIILDATTNKSTEDFFIEQNGQCFSCGDHLGSPQMSRQCYYTQRLYCALCMDGTVSNVIPWKLIENLDTRKYPISANSKKHLNSMYDVPAVPLSKIELPSWYIPTQTANVSMLKNDDDNDGKQQQDNDHDAEIIPNQNEKYYKLIKLGEYLENLSYIKQYFYNNKECADINNVVQSALARRPYLLDAYCTDKDSFGYFLKIIDEHQEDPLDAAQTHRQKKKKKQAKYRLYGLISLRDMFELFNKDLLSIMQRAQLHITQHIKSCKHCKKRSYGANVQFVSKFADILQ